MYLHYRGGLGLGIIGLGLVTYFAFICELKPCKFYSLLKWIYWVSKKTYDEILRLESSWNVGDVLVRNKRLWSSIALISQTCVMYLHRSSCRCNPRNRTEFNRSLGHFAKQKEGLVLSYFPEREEIRGDLSDIYKICFCNHYMWLFSEPIGCCD